MVETSNVLTLIAKTYGSDGEMKKMAFLYPVKEFLMIELDAKFPNTLNPMYLKLKLHLTAKITLIHI
jgi:hypothetical protein